MAARKPGKVGKVRAIRRGYYDGVLREEGEVFDNTLGFPTTSEKPDTWFADASKPGEAEEQTDLDAMA